jgi:hypothetical protein
MNQEQEEVHNQGDAFEEGHRNQKEEQELMEGREDDSDSENESKSELSE